MSGDASAPKGKEGWSEFFTAFEARQDATLTLAAYCDMQGIGYKTARNWASKLRSDGLYPESSKPVRKKPVRTTTKPAAKQGQKAKKSGTNAPKKTGISRDTKKNGDTGDIRDKKQGQNAQVLGETSRDTQRKSHVPIPAAQHPGVGKKPSHLFAAGNRVAVKHGAYAKYLPGDVLESLEEYCGHTMRSVMEEITLTKGRLLMLQKLRHEWDEKAARDGLSEADYPLTELERIDNAEGGSSRELRKRPDFEGQEDRLTRTLAWLMTVQESLRTRGSMSADDKIALRRQIIDDGIIAGWTYAQIGLELERWGLEIPFTLQALIKRELEAPAVEVQEVGISDDELEELSRDFNSKNSGTEEWLEERREEVAAIHAVTDGQKLAK